jgi:hypothetical protein
MKMKQILSLTVFALAFVGCSTPSHNYGRKISSVDDIGVRVDDQGHGLMIFRGGPSRNRGRLSRFRSFHPSPDPKRRGRALVGRGNDDV